VLAARRVGDQLLLARALTLLGVICKEVGQLRHSESCYRDALPILTRLFGGSHPSIATIYHNLGGVLFARAQWARAEHWTRRAIAVRSAALGARHGDVIADEACLAPILAARGKRAEAESIYRRAIRFFSRSKRGLYEVAINSSNLGVLLESWGRYRAAEAAYRRALTSYRAMRHPPPHDLGLVLNNLGVLRAKAGRSGAVSLLQQAHAIFRRALGPRHALTRTSGEHVAKLRTSGQDRPGKSRSRAVGSPVRYSGAAADRTTKPRSSPRRARPSATRRSPVRL
jgi:tetratricopeptide (TPR) repeat protein